MFNSLLAWYFKQARAWLKALGRSYGATSTSRNRLKERDFLELRIPLPSLEHQRSISKRLEILFAGLDSMRNGQKLIARQADALRRALLHHPDSRRVPVSEIMSLRTPDIDVRADEDYSFAGVYSFGRGVFRGDVKSGLQISYSKLTRLRRGDFVYPKLMAWEGAFGVVPDECHGLVVSTEFPVFEITSGEVLPEVVHVYFTTPEVWPLVAGASTGTNVRRRRLKPKDFLRHELLLPPRPAQERLRFACRHILRMADLQHQSESHIEALCASSLHHAFNMGKSQPSPLPS